jgi:hypothetical protein
MIKDILLLANPYYNFSGNFNNAKLIFLNKNFYFKEKNSNK